MLDFPDAVRPTIRNLTGFCGIFFISIVSFMQCGAEAPHIYYFLFLCRLFSSLLISAFQIKFGCLSRILCHLWDTISAIANASVQGPITKRIINSLTPSSLRSCNSSSLLVMRANRIPTSPQTIQTTHEIKRSTHIEITSLH